MSAMKILVVDDERAVRDSLRRALELEGYDVELAGDGDEALYRIEHSDGQPDAVILDVLMPGRDGLEVCRRLRTSGSRVPVLMLTARTECSASATSRSIRRRARSGAAATRSSSRVPSSTCSSCSCATSAKS